MVHPLRHRVDSASVDSASASRPRIVASTCSSSLPSDTCDEQAARKRKTEQISFFMVLARAAI